MSFAFLDMPRVRGWVALGAVLTAAAAAAGSTFSQGLVPKERLESGITRLTPPQVAALDALVDHDVTLAHQGGVTGFSSEFTARHTARECAAAGIDRLSEKERAVLDGLAATAIAYGPPPTQTFTYSPPPVAAAPPPPPAVPVEKLVSSPLTWEVHGDLSFTVGGGSHGSSFYGTGMDVFVTDPSGKFTVGVGFDEFRGRGLFLPWGPADIGPPLRDW